MKYIRTKDGRILESEINDNRKSLGLEPILFIKQSDTIEELCDEFVYEYKDDLPIIHYRERGRPLVSDLYKNMKHSNHISNIYGAIWTDKGLIYVAKMNEKGELELL